MDFSPWRYVEHRSLCIQSSLKSPP